MLIKEYRVPLPLTLEEYRIAQLFTVAQTSLEQTGGGEGVEILKNEPFENVPLLGGKFTKGQYTHKIYHCKTKVPKAVAALAPKGAMVVHEEAWNAYPYCKTVLTNPGYMKNNFHMSVETLHCADRGSQDNVHGLSPSELESREVVLIDIASPLGSGASKIDENPAKFKSTKTGLGPLEAGKWMNQTEPVMTAYKLVRCEFKWLGLQLLIERTIHSFQRKVFHVFHCKLFCWMDRWHGMTLEDVRKYERQIAEQLEERRQKGPIKESAILMSRSE